MTPYGRGVTDAATITGGWRELLGPRYLRTSILLAGGVALYATNEFLTTSLLPNTIAEIGGSRLYAWVTTLYLVGSVVAATMVNPMLLRIGARSSYLLGLGRVRRRQPGLRRGSHHGGPDCGTRPAGRGRRPAGRPGLCGHQLRAAPLAVDAGLGAGVGDVGVATVVGPATGGLFAQFGLWRWAFVAMAILTA